MAAPVLSLLLCVLLSLVPFTLAQTLATQTCSSDGTAVIQEGATAWITGIVSLNEQGSMGFGCGAPGSGSMHSYEAIRLALELLNKKNETLGTTRLEDSYVPGIKLGMKVKNYCDNEQSAIAGISEYFQEVTGDQGSCSRDQGVLNLGIIGGSTSDVAHSLAREAAPLNIPVISYEATASTLTEPGANANFMRTISPDGPLMDVIVELMKKLKWDFVTIVYDSGTYGRTAYSELHERLVAARICVTAGIRVEDDQLITASDTLSQVLNTGVTGVVFFGAPLYARALVERGNGRLPDAGNLQWIFADISLDVAFPDSSIYQRGILAVTAASRFIVEFEDHWMRIDENAVNTQQARENPWFRAWFEEKNACSFTPGTAFRQCSTIYGTKTPDVIEDEKRRAFQQDQYAEAAVMAVYTYASALRSAQMAKCGVGRPGACQALMDMTRLEFYEYLKQVDLTFKTTERIPTLGTYDVAPYYSPKKLSFNERGDVQDASYFIWNFNDIGLGNEANTFQFRRVGSYVNGRLDFNNVAMYTADRQTQLPTLPSSPCPSQPCQPCLDLPVDMKYYYEDGDIIINGIFSLHNMGNTTISCGMPVSSQQYQYLEAMAYALDLVNRDPSMLPGVKLGGLGLDDCSSSVLGQAALAQIQRGNMVIRTPSGVELDPRTIEAYTAAYTSPLTLPLAEAMNMLMRPLVGYRAGSSELDDNSRYPYFIRALPGIQEEMKAVVLLLKKWNWMYVQVVTSFEHYSQNAEEVFRELAAKEGICVVATHNIGYNDRDAEDVVVGLDSKPSASPVISLLESYDNRRFLSALANNTAVRRNLAILATTRWGDQQMIVEGYENAAAGVISLGVQHSTLTSFRSYLSRLQVSNYTTNPWFSEWYQTVHNCSLGVASATRAVCDVNRSITDAPGFEMLYEVESVINSVRAIAKALDAVVRTYCGAQYSTLCSAFTNADNKGQQLMNQLKQVQFPIQDMTSTVNFRFRGSSAEIPFEVYNYVNGIYKQVRTVDPWNQAVLGTTDITLYNLDSPEQALSTCPRPCTECLYLFNYMSYWYIPGDVVIGAIFDIHYSGPGPFMCGEIREINGGLYTEVFNFALNKVNSGTTSVTLDGFKLGGLALDGCTNSIRSTAIINRVLTGMAVTAESGEHFSPTSLVSWMTYDSQTTIDAAHLVQALNMPIVSPGATAPVLNDKTEFTTFFRSTPTDSVIVRGMAELVNEMGWKYVLVLNSPDTANREDRDLFKKMMEAFGICVVAAYEFETDGSDQVIIQSMDAAQTQVVAVFAEPDRHVESFLAAKNAQLTSTLDSKRYTFISNRKWGRYAEQYKTTALTGTWLENSLYFVEQKPTIDEFITYLDSLNGQNYNSNPWYRDIYQEVLNCNLPGSFDASRGTCDATNIPGGFLPITSGSRWEQDIWTLSTINAVYAIAKAVNNVKVAVCGPSVPLCPAFFSQPSLHQLIMDQMDVESFIDIDSQRFEFINREVNRGIRVFRYRANQQEQMEGMFNNDDALRLLNQAGLQAIYSNIQAGCGLDCDACVGDLAGVEEFTLIPGDIYIVGLFDVHEQNSKSPYTCGPINTKHGLPLMEAFHFALEYVNNKTGIFSTVLPSVQLGGVALDMCKSPSRAANLVANIHSGDVTLSKNGETINPRRIDAYVATMDTESSIRVADVLTELAMPQISYGATGLQLLDRAKYGYFFRSVPADDKQARAIVSYLKKFSYNNIQVIYSFDEIGEPGFKEFERLALVNKICIKEKYLVGETGEVKAGEAEGVIGRILAATGTKAEVVIVWMKNPLAILEAANRYPVIYSSYLFVVTDKWGVEPQYLSQANLRNILPKVVTFDVETADIPAFDEFLEKKTPANYKTNPWFEEYFEYINQCTWQGDQGLACDPSKTLPRASDYVQDPYVLYVINAVFSAAMGIHGALQKLCDINGVPYIGVCDLYRQSGERRQRVREYLKQVNFTDNTHQPYFYLKDGQSDRGFHIYNITNSGGDLEYMNVGSYNDSNFLKLDISYDSTFNARCDADSATPDMTDDCICPFPPNLPSRYMKKTEGGRGLTLVYVGDIHQANPNNKLGCGPINTGVDLQRLLAFFYAIDRINQNSGFNLVDSLKLDGLALDSCTSGLRLGQDVYNVLSGNKFCDSDDTGLLVSPSSIIGFVVDKDHNSVPVSNMLQEQKITAISPTATLSAFNNRYNHPYFLRTRNNDQQLANVVLDISRAAGWNFVSVIYSDDLKHRSGVESLLASSRLKSVCMADAVALKMDATLDDAVDALEKVARQVGAQGVALYVEPAHLRLLMEASQAAGMGGTFTWVVLTDWADDLREVSGLNEQLDGAIVVNTRSAVLADFTQYLMNMTFTNRQGIPDDWFLELYQTLHQCTLIDQELGPQKRYPNVCTKDERITAGMIMQDPSVLHVIISVYSAALGMNAIPQCTRTNIDLAACLQVQENRGDLIYRGISSVNFRVLPELLGDQSFQFFFDSEGNGQAGYIIQNFRLDQSLNNYGTFQIGTYGASGLSLDLRQYGSSRSVNLGELMSSSCALGATCQCQLPGGNTWDFSPNPVLDPSNVRVGMIYRDPMTGEAVNVTGIPQTYDRFDKAWGIILAVLAGLGAFIALIIFVYLLVMYPIRGGTSILGYILSFGIVLLYLMVIPFIAHADTQMCGLRRFGLGLVYAIVYSSLLVKLVDCWRVRSKGDAYSVKYSKLGRPAGLFMVTTFLVLVQVMISSEWLILRPPSVERVFYDTLFWPRCLDNDFYDEGLVLSLSYIMVLIVVSLFLCLLTFTSTTNHRESRWILGILVVSVPCWVIWCAVATLGALSVRDPAVAVGLLVNATTMLLLVPVRKLYLLHKYNVLIDEEDSSDMGSQYQPSHKGTDYNSTYGRQYDQNPRLHDTGSNVGSHR